MIKILYFAILTSFFAAQIFTIDLGFFQLSLFRVAILLAPILLVLKALKSRYPIYLIPNGKNRYSVRFMILWAFYALISIAWVNNYSSAFRSLYFIISGVICIIIFSIFLNKKKHFIIAFNLMHFMVLIHNIIGWYEIFTRDYKFISVENIIYYSNIKNRIPISMLGNPNDYALLMFFGVFISYACFKINNKKIYKFIPIVTLISSYIMIFATQSRANIIGILISTTLFLILTKKHKKYLILSLILTGVVLLIIFQPSIIEILMNRINMAFEFRFDQTNLNSEVKRINLIRNGLYFLIMTLGFGTGSGNIEHWMQYRAIYPVGMVTNIHNWWMEILVGYGIFIFILYMKFFLKLLISMYAVVKNKLTTEFNKSISLSIFLSLIGFVIASLSSSSNIVKEWLWVYWAVVIAFQGYVYRCNDKVNNEGN